MVTDDDQYYKRFESILLLKCPPLGKEQKNKLLKVSGSHANR